MCAVNPTTGQSNLTKMPHRCRTWTVQSYSPGGGNVHPHLTHASLGLPQCIPQTASWSFLHSSEKRVPGPFLPRFPLLMGDLDHHLVLYMVPWAQPSPQPKWHLDQFSRFCSVHDHDRLTDWQTDHAPPSVKIDRIYVCSTVIQPKNA